MTVMKFKTAKNPKISVVIPALFASEANSVVDSLRHQSIDEPYEVIVSFGEDLSVSEARNEGLEAADSDYVAFTDTDCIPTDDWLETIYEKFTRVDDLVGLDGATEGPLDSPPKLYTTANFAVDRDVFLEAGGFREEYAGWREDTEAGWRLEEFGPTMFTRDAVVIHPSEPNSTVDRSIEQKLKEEYPDRYRARIVPDGVVPKLNYHLWVRGFWDFVSRWR